jgi:hypothetical protein
VGKLSASSTKKPTNETSRITYLKQMHKLPNKIDKHVRFLCELMTVYQFKILFMIEGGHAVG